MNKNLHRIIFNAARGMRMVVQETATSAGKAPGATSGQVAAAAALAGMLLATPAQAQLNAAQNVPANQRPTVLVAPNGVPLVNIQTPSAAGVSRNVYNQFNVPANGVILNNARTSVQTQLGGWVQGNPYLANGSARIILNEVNGGNPTQMRGYLEVAGQRANVIIANPAGISVNGGGFINVDRATLTTGVPQLNAVGGLESFMVRGGTVTIEGAGLDASQTDYAAILARAVQANAGIWAGELKVVTGVNDISADHSQVTSAGAGAGNGAAPTFALDVAHLGGMYARKIVLVGTEAGVGVRNAGNLGAGAGGIVVTADGRIENSGTIEAPRVQLASSADIDNRGGTIRQSGGAALEIQTPVLRNTNGGVIGAEPVAAGTTGTGGHDSGNGATAGGTDAAQTGDGGTGMTGGSASTGSADGGAVVAPAPPPQPGSITAGGTLHNDGGRIYAGGPVRLQAPQIDNSGGSLNVEDLAVSGPQFSNAGGTLNVRNNFNANVQALDNSGGTLNAGHIDISTRGDLRNVDGTLASNGDARLNVGGAVDNSRGVISAVGALTAEANGNVNNNAGTLSANQALALKAGALDNSGGRIASSQATVDLNVLGALRNTGDGQIAAATDLGLQASSIVNEGSLRAGGDITINVDDALVQSGTLTAGHNASVDAGSVQAGQSSVFGAGVQEDGTLGNAGDLHLNAGGALAANGQNIAAGSAVLQGASVDVASSQTSATDITLVATQGNVTTSGAQVVTPGTLNISAKAQSTQTLVNNDGQINAGQLDLQVANLVNTNEGEIVQTGNGATRIEMGGTLDNTGGRIASNGDLTIGAASLYNDAGRITSMTSLHVDTGAASNVEGTLAANDQLTLQATGLDNTRGSIGAVTGNLHVDTQGTTNNSAGQLLSGGALTLTNAGLNNTDGQATGQSLSVDTRGAALDNTRGTLGSTAGAATLRTGALNNDAGLIQSAQDLQLDTQGQQLLNRNAAGHASSKGGITSGGALDLRSGALDNSSGYIGAKGDLSASTAAVTNAGLLLSQGALSVDTHGAGFDNRGGQTQAVGDLQVLAGSVNNSGALIRSAGTATLTAANLLNRDTLGADQGIEATSIAIAAAEVDNTRGAIRADDSATLTSSGTLDNTGGLISAQQALRIADRQATKTLDVRNTGGTLVSNQDLTIDAANLSSDGTVTAGRDLGVALTQDVTNNVNVSAAGNLSYTTTGRFTNNASFTAGKTLTVGGANVDNNATGELSSANTIVNTPGVLNNWGLIDSTGHTQVNAGTLNNMGTGRIYGNSIAINAAALNNTAETINGVTAAGSIASRTGDIDIGVQQLVNDEALISSGADLRIGGALNADGHATGRAQSVTNIAAIIESTGNMVLGAQRLDNLNRGFSTKEQVIDEAKNDHFIALYPNGTRYTQDELGSCHRCQSNRADDGSAGLPRREYVIPSAQYPFEKGYSRHPYQLPANGGNYPDDDLVWTLFDVPAGDVAALTPKLVAYNFDLMNRASRDYTDITVTGIQTTQTVVDNPGQAARISSGGNMTLDIGTGNNTNSQVIAGGALLGNADSLTNTETTGRLNVVESGYWASHAIEYSPYGRIKDGVYGAGAYQKVIEDRSIDLSTSVKLPNTAPGSVGPTPGAASTGSASAQAGTAGAANGGNRPGAIFEVASNVQAGTQADGSAGTHATAGAPTVVRTAGPNASIPTASLFGVHAGPGGPLIETDPRFANYRAWLSSDYLLAHLGLDPAYTQKRLGDGYYEQRLIREQVAQLTGQRWLQGYSNDEDMYTALMNAGVTFAQQFQLTPGVGLTAAQMAQLTSDIVWLVEQSVTLPDGSVQKVLVPQLYVRVKEGDINGAGALLAGDSVDLKLTGDVTNSGGTIAGRQALKIDADNIHNLAGGRIIGQDVALNAKTDLNNIGATIDAGNSLGAKAGRDINIQSTTRSASRTLGANSSSLTQIDRVGGLYVSAEGSGKLDVNAGRDVNLNAGVIANAGSGTTNVTAGRDLNLGTVTESRWDNYIASSKQYSKLSQSQEVGSLILGNGDVTLDAGNDLNARAAQIASVDGKASLTAGHDVVLDAGRATRDSDNATYSSSKTLLKKTTTTTRDQLQTDEAIGGSVSGKSVLISASNDLVTRAATLQSEDDMELRAGRDLLLGTSEESRTESHARQVKKSATGLAKGLGIMLAAGGVVDVAVALNSKASAQKAGTSTEHTARGSTVSAGSLTTHSGRDTTVSGSTIVADGDIEMDATRDLTIQSAQGSYSGSSQESSSKSGMVGKVWQPSFGSIKQNEDGQRSGTTQSASQVASLQGNVKLTAGGTYRQTGSDVLALGQANTPGAAHQALGDMMASGQPGEQARSEGGNITIQARNVVIDESLSSRETQTQGKSSSTVLGGSASVAGISIETLQSLKDTAKATQETDDSRMQALGVATLAMQGKQLVDTAQSIAAGGGVGYKVSVNLSHNKSQSQSTGSQSEARGSSVVGAGNVDIRATGGGQDSNILVRGSDIEAGDTATLQADNKIQLEASQNHYDSQSTNKSSGQSVGVGFAGGSQNGFTIELGVSQGKGNFNGSETVNNNTHVKGGKAVVIDSGGDSVLKGGVIEAPKVTADVGGDLKIESLQDTAESRGKQSSAGVNLSLCIPPICYGTSTASGNVAKASANGSYANVTEQSGIRAGDGGFAVDVKGKTGLVGGVVSSTQAAIDAGRNTFTSAGGVTTTDITNHSDFEAEGYSLSGGVNFSAGDQSKEATVGKSEADKKAAKNALNSNGVLDRSAGYASESGSQTSVSKAGISGVAGDTSVRTGDAQSQLDKPKDTNELIKDVQGQAQITAQFGRQAAEEWGTYANGKFVDALKNGDKEAAACWAPDGVCRAVGHGVVGAATGGVGGAAGGATVSLTAPHVQSILTDIGLPEQLTQGLTAAYAAGVGGAVGGAAGAAAGYNESENNNSLAGRLILGGIVEWGGAAAAKRCLANASCVAAVGSGVVALQEMVKQSEQSTGTPTLGDINPTIFGGAEAFEAIDPSGIPNHTGNSTPSPDYSGNTVTPADTQNQGETSTATPGTDLTQETTAGGGYGSGGVPDYGGDTTTPNSGPGQATLTLNLNGTDQTVQLPSLIDADRAAHILTGDGPGKGGHLWPGQPGKSAFPQSWDADRVLGEISDVATDPQSARSTQPDGRVRVRGTRAGVDILVIVEPPSRGGRIVTGYPINLPRNP